MAYVMHLKIVVIIQSPAGRHVEKKISSIAFTISIYIFCIASISSFFFTTPRLCIVVFVVGLSTRQFELFSYH